MGGIDTLNNNSVSIESIDLFDKFNTNLDELISQSSQKELDGFFEGKRNKFFNDVEKIMIGSDFTLNNRERINAVKKICKQKAT